MSPPADDSGSGTGIANGQVDPGSAGFEIEFKTAGDGGSPIAGPFVLQGRNIHYDTSLGALIADLSVINRGRGSHPEPVVLTFESLLPPGVQVLNPDNGEHGPGAAIIFEFANRDGMWTPGEESLPRTVEFGVDPATSIGFVARLDIGMSPRGGVIGGIVWGDGNGNGVMDPNEHGLGGIELMLADGEANDSLNAHIIRVAITEPDGTYRFDGLDPGLYTVFKRSQPPWWPTTPPILHVILVEVNGEVGDFLMANFGCGFAQSPEIGVGDYIRAVGEFVQLPGPLAGEWLVALEITLFDCGNRGCVRPGILRGTVLAVDRSRRAIRVMNEWVAFAPMDSVPSDSSFAGPLDPGDVDVGDRVMAMVRDAPGDSSEPRVGLFLSSWAGVHDEAAGYVKRIGGDPSHPPADIVILRRTQIVVTPDTRINVFETR